MAIIAVALSVGLYFGLQDDSGSGKNSTETTNGGILGDLNQVLPPEDENDTKADENDTKADENDTKADENDTKADENDTKADENDTKTDDKDDGKSESNDENESKDENVPDEADSEYG